MSVLENFKNIPRSPYGGRQGSNVNFFSSNLQRSPWRKKEGACRPLGGGDRVPSPYFKPWPPFAAIPFVI